MSGSDARSKIESEYEEAKETALVYLLAVGVLGSDIVLMNDYRRREICLLWDAILKDQTAVVELPNDPFARDAAKLGHRYLRHGYESDVLEILLKKNTGHPAYRWALLMVAHGVIEANAKLPERLEEWVRKSAKVEKRWRWEATRRYRIGLVVDAMVTGSDALLLCGENERTQRQLQADLQMVCQQFDGESVRELSPILKRRKHTEYVLAKLNGMKSRPWKHWNGRDKGLTASDLVELTKQPRLEGVGIDAIIHESKVTKHFPHLYATRNPETAEKALDDDDVPRSICDAVSEVLRTAGIQMQYGTVLKAWMSYRRDGLSRDG